MYLDTQPTADRIRAAVPVLAVHALLALVLLNGLQGNPPQAESDPPRLIRVPPLATVLEPEPPPPPPADDLVPSPSREADPRPGGAASPPKLKAEPAPFVAPEPIVRLPIQPPPTVPTAPVAAQGSAPSAGAAPIRGPGTGSGGFGAGRGSGRGGDGAGGGGGGGGGDGASQIVARPPRWVCCDLSIGDVPRAVQERTRPGVSVVSVIYVVEADGRVTGCRVSRSSGNRELDQVTCALVERRYRFQPARNPAGRPVRAVGVGDDHEWQFEEIGSRRRRDDW